MTTSTSRQQYRALVADIAARAKAILPTQVNGRIEKAVTLVLQGDVAPQDDGTVTLFSATDATRRYILQGHGCTCADFERGQAPEGWCAHRIAAGIDKRVREVLAALPAPAPEASSQGPLPEAPVSITIKGTAYGQDVMVTLRGYDFASVQAQVEQASAWLRSQAPAQASSQGQGWCQTHGVPMQEQHKNGRTWYSHKTADGWCKGR
jgi:hypothetical protein